MIGNKMQALEVLKELMKLLWSGAFIAGFLVPLIMLCKYDIDDEIFERYAKFIERWYSPLVISVTVATVALWLIFGE